jgi:CDP-diglyceride synthetase
MKIQDGLSLLGILLASALVGNVGAFQWLGPAPGKSLPHAYQNTRAITLPPLYEVKHKHVSSENLENHHSVEPKPSRRLKRDIPKRAVKVYTDYAGRLWKETNPAARRRIATTKAAAALRQVQHILRGDEYCQIVDNPDDEQTTQARMQLLSACEDLLSAMGQNAASKDEEGVTVEEQIVQDSLTVASHTAKDQLIIAAATHDAAQLAADNTTNDQQALTVASSSTDDLAQPVRKKKNRRSILFGATMGACVAAWVFSGNYIFTGLFTLMTTLGQLEYYRMVMNTGVYPARRISVIGACTMFVTALFFPDYHQICLPLFGLWTMVWFLTMRRKPATIPEIATTFTGLFYLGYVPSFWVRVRTWGAPIEFTRLAPWTQPMMDFLQRKAQTNLPALVPKAIVLPASPGAIFIFWTWMCLAFSDVGAYFVGKFHGKTKLGAILPAAGATSPNKTVEGVIGGCAASAVIGVFGTLNNQCMWMTSWIFVSNFLLL